MTVGVPTCAPDTPVIDLARRMVEKDWEAVVVLSGDDGHALGVVSRSELIKAYGHSGVNELKAEDIMRDDVPQVPPEVPLTAAAQIMQDMGVRAVFMMHHAGGIEYPAAVLTYQHLLRHLTAGNEADLSDLGIKADRESPLETFIRRRDEARRRATGRDV